MSTAPSEALMPKSKKVKKPALKAVPTPKAKAKPKIKTTDELVALAYQCENMTREAAYAALPELMDARDFNYIRLGGVLAVIRDKEWWKEDGYESFKDCLAKKFGFDYRKGAYMVSTYENLIKSGVDWEDVKDLGWSKLRVVSSVLTKDNVEEWVAKAANLTVLALYDVVKAFKAQTLETSGVTPEEIPSTTTTMSFKVHVDQKETIRQALDKAREEANTEFDGVALEAICINFLAGGKVTKPKSLVSMLQKYTAKDVLLAFGKAFPSVVVEVDEDTLDA